MDPSSASSVPLALLGEQQAHKKRKKEPQYKEEDLAFVGMVLGDEAAGANPSTAKDEDDQAEEEEEDNDDDDDGYGGDGGSGGGGAGEEEADRLYCLCRMPEDPNDPYMVQCDRCQEWYHLSCIGISMAAAKRMPEYICKECQLDIGNLVVLVFVFSDLVCSIGTSKHVQPQAQDHPRSTRAGAAGDGAQAVQ